MVDVVSNGDFPPFSQWAATFTILVTPRVHLYCYESNMDLEMDPILASS